MRVMLRLSKKGARGSYANAKNNRRRIRKGRESTANQKEARRAPDEIGIVTEIRIQKIGPRRSLLSASVSLNGN